MCIYILCKRLSVCLTLVIPVVVLSCILFHRLFGPSIPQTKEGLGVTYPCVENSEVETLIEDKLIQLIKLERTTSSKQIQVGVQFFEKRPKKPSWFGKTSEDVCWEQWVININIDQEISRKRIENQVREILLSIVGVVNTNKEHIPPITTTDATPFPYQIVVPSSDQSNNATTIEGWGSVIKKMLVDAPE